MPASSARERRRIERDTERIRLAGCAFACVVLPCAACDPLVDVAGAFFPGWMLCILAAVVATVLIRYLFSRTGLEPSLGPLIVIYPSLATTIALALWLGFYRHGP
jgi:hypothetical protein